MNSHASYPLTPHRPSRVPRHEITNPSTPKPSLAAEAVPMVVVILGTLGLVLIGAPIT